MSTSIRLNDELVRQAREQGALLHRSPPEQVEHWAWLGSVMENVLSCPAQASLSAAIAGSDIDEALSRVGTREGDRRAREVIAVTSKTIVSND